MLVVGSQFSLDVTGYKDCKQRPLVVTSFLAGKPSPVSFEPWFMFLLSRKSVGISKCLAKATNVLLNELSYRLTLI